jgi:hypothetical protein
MVTDKNAPITLIGIFQIANYIASVAHYRKKTFQT